MVHLAVLTVYSVCAGVRTEVVDLRVDVIVQEGRRHKFEEYSRRVRSGKMLRGHSLRFYRTLGHPKIHLDQSCVN